MGTVSPSFSTLLELGIPTRRIVTNVANVGNTATASITLTLADAVVGELRP